MTARSLTIFPWVFCLVVGCLRASASAQQPVIISEEVPPDAVEAAPPQAAASTVPEPAVDATQPQAAASAAPPAPVDSNPLAARSGETLDAPRGLFAQIAVGAGFGARAISIPSRRSDRRLSTGFFPSLQVALHGELALRRRWLFGAAVSYQTAVGLQAASVAPRAGNSVEGAELRSNSLTFGIMPGYRFGREADSVALRVLLGWGFRSLHTVVDLETPSYSLHGFTLRPELTVPLNHGIVVLRIAPEVAALVGASQRLVDLSNASLPGVALGGEASIDVHIYASLHAALAYRESYALLSTEWGSYLRDSERFITLQLALHR